MKSLIDIFLNKYFIIDEPQEVVYDSATIASSGHGKSGQEDLITLISQIMLENEQLQDIQKELESRASSPEMLEGVVKKLITILDGFERVLNLSRQYPPSPEVDNWLKSVETLYFRLMEILEKIGLKTLDTIGKPVNLNFHDVVEYKPTTDYPNDTVIYERQRGYVLNG